MRDPLYSVIVPLFNKGPHISRTIRSILAQSFQDFELVIVNDASTDNSLQEIGRFKDSRIRLLHRSVPGPGGYAARNLGIQAARAAWVSFLDADDTWEADYLEKMHELQKMFPRAAILCCGWRIQGEDGSTRVNQYTKHFEQRGPHLIDLMSFLRCSARGYSPMCASVVTARRDIMMSIGGFPEGRCRRGGDVDTWLRGMLQAKLSAWYPGTCAVYHHEAVNRVTQYTPYDLAGACTPQTVRKHLEIERDAEIRRELKRFSNRYQLSGIKQKVKEGALTKADIRTLYRDAEPLRILPYIVTALFPKPLQRWASRVYARIF